jgi:hypothetical protein
MEQRNRREHKERHHECLSRLHCWSVLRNALGAASPCVAPTETQSVTDDKVVTGLNCCDTKKTKHCRMEEKRHTFITAALDGN